MDNFDCAVQTVLENEGSEFIDDPVDRGAATRYGITLRLYKSISPGATIEDIRNLDEATAKKIYKLYFWKAAPFDQIYNLRVATSVFDCSVNCGVQTAIVLCQRACNSLLTPVTLIDVDGRLGRNTILAINRLDPVELLTAFRDERKKYYEKIIENDPSQEKFRDGWLRRAMT